MPKYKIAPGDIFIIISELELDLEDGRLVWNKDKTQLIYWIRSDRLAEKCRELGIAAGEDVERLKSENEELRRRVEELEAKLRSLEEENEVLRRENEELKNKLESIARVLKST